MSLEHKRPAVVAFDGLHRAGKGTQAGMLQISAARNGIMSVIVRGDGTRDGLGLHSGDPYSEEWQTRGRQLKSPEGNTIEDWNAAAYVLARELVAQVNENDSKYDLVIVDRSLLSRVAFLLHRGAQLKGERLTLDSMYPDNEIVPPQERIDLASIVPDVIFDMRVDDPRCLLGRLDPEDPKYRFRSQNIKGGFDSANIAAKHLPEEIEHRVISLDATKNPNELHEKIMSHLGRTGLTNWS